MSVKKILYNTVLQSGGKIISVLLGLTTIAYLTPYLGQDGFGEYTTVVAFMGFVGILADLGLYLVTTKEISVPGADEKKILGNVFALRFVTVVAMLLIGAVVSLFFPYSTAVKHSMFVAILAFTFVSGTQVLVGVFQRYLIFYQLVGSEIVQRLLMLGLTLLFIFLRLDLIYFIWALAISNGAHFFLSLYLARRQIPFWLRFDLSFWWEILTRSWPLAFSVVLNLIYFKADTLILSVFKPASDVGTYGLSYKFLEVLLSFPAMFAGLIMPFLARYAFSEWAKYRLYLQKSLDAILLVIVPMVVVVCFYARPIVNLVGGGIYPDADAILKILIFATAVIYIGNLFGYTVVALNSQKAMVWGYFFGTLIGLGLYFFLIPKYSYFGAAIGTLAVETFVTAFAYFLTSKKAGFLPSFVLLFKAFTAGVPMILFFRFLNFPWALEAGTGLVIYFLALLILRAIPREFFQQIYQSSRAGSAPEIVGPGA
ncbi:MAG: flippase [Patescibacteria group bacterium]|nr:flippase [Patescibacteria group bacterium]